MQILMPRMMTQCFDLDGLGDGVGVGVGLDDRVGDGLELGGTVGDGDDLLGVGVGVEE